MTDQPKKAAVSRPKNALTHGLYAEDYILPWEDETECKELQARLVEVYNPENTSEEMIVSDLAQFHWRKQRLRAAARLRYRRDPLAKALQAASEKNGWRGVVDHIADMQEKADSARSSMLAAAGSYAQALREVTDRLTAALRDGADVQGEGVDRNTSIAQITELKRAVDQMEVTRLDLGPMLKILQNDDLDEIVSARAYSQENILRELRAEEDIDRQIRKKMTDMVQHKEYQKLYGRKTINHLPLEHVGDAPTTQPAG